MCGTARSEKSILMSVNQTSLKSAEPAFSIKAAAFKGRTGSRSGLLRFG